MFIHSLMKKMPGGSSARQAAYSDNVGCEDEPPSKIQHPERYHNLPGSSQHSAEHLYRLLLWRGTVHHRSGSFMCAGSGICDRWLYLVLGTGEHEEQNGE